MKEKESRVREKIMNGNPKPPSDRMITVDFPKAIPGEGGRYTTSVLLEQGAVKLRRIELGAGARIPPCQMREDVVFVVVAGRVTFRAGTEEARVASPGAVFIPGGAISRSMKADEASLVVAVLCRRKPGCRKSKKGKSEA